MNVGQVALTALLWEASIVLWSIAFVELKIGENDPKDFGIVLLSAALLETISLVFIIASKDAFGAVVGASFILLLWILGWGLIAKTNGVLQTHAVWFTGFYFLFAGIFAAKHGLISFTALFWLLVIVTWLLALKNYGKGKKWSDPVGKLSGFFSFATAILLFVMAFTNAIGKPLP